MVVNLVSFSKVLTAFLPTPYTLLKLPYLNHYSNFRFSIKLDFLLGCRQLILIGFCSSQKSLARQGIKEYTKPALNIFVLLSISTKIKHTQKKLFNQYRLLLTSHLPRGLPTKTIWVLISHPFLVLSFKASLCVIQLPQFLQKSELSDLKIPNPLNYAASFEYKTDLELSGRTKCLSSYGDREISATKASVS